MVNIALTAEDEWGFALVVYSIDVCAESRCVDHEQFITSEGCVVNGRFTTQVARINRDAFFHEVQHRYGLVTLCTNVHHRDTGFVLSMYVRPVLDEQTDHVEVAMEAREVQSCEAILALCVLVEPLPKVVPPLHHAFSFTFLFAIRREWSITFIGLNWKALEILTEEDKVDKDFASLILHLERS